MYVPLAGLILNVPPAVIAPVAIILSLFPSASTSITKTDPEFNVTAPETFKVPMELPGLTVELDVKLPIVPVPCSVPDVTVTGVVPVPFATKIPLFMSNPPVLL